MDASALLGNSDLFGALDEDALGHVAALAEPISFSRGEALLTQGSAADRLYVLLTGAVGIRTSLVDRGDVLVESVERPGEVFGASALVEPYEYTFTARAQAEGSALVIAREPLLALLEARPSLGLSVYRGLARTAIAQLDHTRASLMTVMTDGAISHG
jgi:CRP-like cAMP-binding protein